MSFPPARSCLYGVGGLRDEIVYKWQVAKMHVFSMDLEFVGLVCSAYTEVRSSGDPRDHGQARW